MSSRIHEIGALLEERRKCLGITVNEAAAVTKIRPHYLVAIEHGNIAELPSSTYGIGYIRSYAYFLGLNGDEIITLLRTAEKSLETHDELYVPALYREDSLPGLTSILTAILLVCIVYGIWYYRGQAHKNYSSQVEVIAAVLSAYHLEGLLLPPIDKKIAPQKDYAIAPLLDNEIKDNAALAIYAKENSWITITDSEGAVSSHYIRKGEWYFRYDAREQATTNDSRNLVVLDAIALGHLL